MIYGNLALYLLREIDFLNHKLLNMKQIYFFIAAMFVGTIATAQVKMPVQAAKDAQVSSINSEAPIQAARAVFWSHDCNIDNCSDWSFDNGAYEVGAPWADIDINFECTLDGPAGPYNQWAGGSGDGSATSAMNSTTSANGMIMVDSDLFGADANYDANWVENCWFQTVAPIDCSEHPYVSISLETRYRCWDNGGSDDSEKCLIEISRDGVNWPTIDNWDEASGYVIYGTDTVPSRKEVFPGYGTSDMSDNPSLLEFDITEAAGAQGEIYVRFRWSGTWGYSWEIDDIKVYDTPAHDTRIDNYVSYTDFERTGYYEYGAWAQSQIPADLTAAAKVYNVGYEYQTNVTLEVTANGVAASSDPITLDYATEDTLTVAYLPTALGPVTVDYLLSADMADENPSNNMASQSYDVTDLSWGRDDGMPTNSAPNDGTDDYIAVSLFDIVEDVVIYAIDVAIMDGSETGTSIITHLFDGFDDTFLTEQYGGILQSTDEFDIIEGNTNAEGEAVTTWYTMVFQTPFMASAGDWLGAGFEHYGGSNVQYGESKFTPDNTAFIYGPFGAGSAYDWYYTNEVPMVRLNLDPNAVNTISEEQVNTTGFQMFPSFPNPTNGITRVQFSLDRASEVTFEVRDITGKIVFSTDLGTQASGYNSISLDASDYAAGAYTYTLTVNGERATDRLMVK
ncbi:MAG TPA: T9SS type A sorting domain-containing protein [Flavobacteriales bacterium]|nr:T9SS type A sorting domain-containing protein [Flavobacteriales bacterium]HIO16096.1 T9SS type A sorting domain-containing protein [Flavobacteriales bacterium]